MILQHEQTEVVDALRRGSRDALRASWTCRRGTIGGGEVDVAAEDWFATYPGIIPDEIQRQLLDSWYPHQH